VHEPSPPDPAWQAPRKPGQHRPVRPVHPGSGYLPAEHRQPRAAAPVAPRSWSPSAAPAASAIPAAGRSSDRAVVAPSTDHLCHRLPRRTRSSEAMTDFLTPTRHTTAPSLSEPAAQTPCRSFRTYGSSSGERWPAPPSSVAAWSAAPGPTIAGTAAHAVAHDRLLGQALSDLDQPSLRRLLAASPASSRTVIGTTTASGRMPPWSRVCCWATVSLSALLAATASVPCWAVRVT
jgi:hypothetical protein